MFRARAPEPAGDGALRLLKRRRGGGGIAHSGFGTTSASLPPAHLSQLPFQQARHGVSINGVAASIYRWALGSDGHAVRDGMLGEPRQA